MSEPLVMDVLNELLTDEALADLMSDAEDAKRNGPPFEFHPDTGIALVREVQQRREQVRTLEAANACLRSTLHMHPSAALLDEMTSLRARVAELDGLRGQLAIAHAFSDDMQARVDDLESELRLANVAADTANGAADSLRQQVHALTEERDDTVVKLTSERSNLRARVAESEGDLARLEERACGTCDPSPYVTPEARKVAKVLADVDSLRSDVTRLTEERDVAKLALSDVAEALDWKGHHDLMATFVSTLRARVAELEARNAKSENERGLALLAKQEHERAASRARDAALEEARLAAKRRLYELGLSASLCIEAAKVIDALKFQPARRFVDAEEVAKVLRAVRSDARRITDRRPVVDAIAKRLGLTLDGEKP